MTRKNPLELDREGLPPEVTAPVAEDPVVEECLRDALAQFDGMLSPEEVEEHRRFLEVVIRTHPEASRLYERLRQRPTFAGSGDVAKDGALIDDGVDANLVDGTVGGRR